MFPVLFFIVYPNFGKGQGAQLSDASAAPIYKIKVVCHMTTIMASCLWARRNWKAQIRLYYAV